MPQFNLDLGLDYDRFKTLDLFTRAYVEAMFFTESGDDEGQWENSTFADVSPEALESIKADCAAFQKDVGEMIAEDIERAGRDFWYTRQGHGAGFWDGDWPEFGDELTKASKAFGEVYAYVGDDGKIYI